tara:strand:+ start:813 stop:1505 length:693 start_codon:yes stop_codon:yes gene_type:complete
MKILDASLLVNLAPFVGIDRVDLDDLISKAHAIRFEKDRHIFEQDELSHSFFLLLDGHIRVVKVTPHGEQVIARYISSGELFGIAQAMGRTTYPANAVAAVDCVVLSWPDAIWQDTITKYPSFASNTYKTIGDRLQDTQERIMEMATERVEQRVAHALIKLVEQAGKKTDEGQLIDFPISRQDISEMTGTTLHTVSRLLSAWEQGGLVKSGRKKVFVVNQPRLNAIAMGH